MITLPRSAMTMGRACVDEPQVVPRDWPGAGLSRFERVAGQRWHLQRDGSGPLMLLLHGTGASTHSWRHLRPLLTPYFETLAVDLPGHGFSSPIPGEEPSLPAMSAALGRLLAALHEHPAVIVGHSAGAAVAAQLVLDGHAKPETLVLLNGALYPFEERLHGLFSGLARALVNLPLVARLAAARAGDRKALERLMRSTGSALSASDLDCYARLLSNRHHVRAVLRMMAAWSLDGLVEDMATLPCAVCILAGANDQTVPPAQAQALAAFLGGAGVPCTLDLLPGLGHLAHEEAPEIVARHLLVRLGVCA